MHTVYSFKCFNLFKYHSPTMLKLKCGFKGKRYKARGSLMTKLQYLIPVLLSYHSPWVINRTKYISGLKDLPLLLAEIILAVIYIRMSIINCQPSKTITVRTRLDTLHVQYWMTPVFICLLC